MQIVPDNDSIPEMNFARAIISFSIVLIIEWFDVGHAPNVGFVSGVYTEVAIKLGGDHFVLFHESVEHVFSVPVGWVRVTIVDDLIRCPVESVSAPFAVKEIEVESSLFDEREAAPCLAEINVSRVLSLGVNQFKKMRE